MSDARSRTAGTIVVAGAHPTSGYSMSRYTSLLAAGWRATGAEVRRLDQITRWSDQVERRAVRKWVAYVEKFVLTIPRLRRISRTAHAIHIADHSDAIWALALPRATRVYVTCHDLFAVRAALGELPEHRPGATGRVYQWLVLRGLHRATLIFCASESTATDVRRLIGRPTVLLYNPLDQGFAHRCHLGDEDEPPRPYVLVVGSSGWRKRREAALAAWLRLRRTQPFHGVELRMVGPPLTAGELQDIPADTLSEITVESAASEERLTLLYSQASAALVLSRYEGFGWPLIEAQATGTPVLAADIPSLVEVGGAGAVFMHVEDIDRLDHQSWSILAEQLMDGDLAIAAGRNLDRFRFEGFVSNLANILDETTSVVVPVVGVSS
jgi:glycosyltransferase involved in cell wall biosynthesis